MKDDEKNGKRPVNGTQEPMKKTARDRDSRTHEQTARDRDHRTRGDERKVQGESADIRHAELVHKEMEYADEIICSHLVKEASKSETHAQVRSARRSENFVKFRATSQRS